MATTPVANKDSFTITIANGATKSSTIPARGRSLVRIDFPTMTGTSATIQGSDTDSDATFLAIGNESATFTITTPSGRSVTLPPYYTYRYDYLRIVSSGAEASDRSIVAYVNNYTE